MNTSAYFVAIVMVTSQRTGHKEQVQMYSIWKRSLDPSAGLLMCQTQLQTARAVASCCTCRPVNVAQIHSTGILSTKCTRALGLYVSVPHQIMCKCFFERADVLLLMLTPD